MKTIVLKCATCNTNFTKALKEYTRQIKKNPKRKFYCSMRCSGKNGITHLNGKYGFVSGSEAHKRAVLLAAEMRHKVCPVEDRPFREYLRRSGQRKHECSLTIEEIKKVWLFQGGRCAISNIPIELVGIAENPISLASIDRIDSSKGYIVGNIQFVSSCINYAKSSMTDSDAHTLMRLIREHYIDKQNSIG